MKKSAAVLVLLALFAAAWALAGMLHIPGFDNLALASLVGVMLVIAFFYLRFEESRSDPRVIAIIGALSALSVAGRVLTAAIPNVQPSTFIIIAGGYVFGPLSGFMIGATTALVSNFFLGHGPWTPWQMLAWGLAGFVSGLFGISRRLEGRYGFALYCAAWGFLYGFIVNAYFVLGFIYPLTLRSALASYGAGLWFDMFHAAGNFAFALLLGPALVAMLRRYRSRFEFEMVQPGPRGLEVDTGLE